MVLAPLVFVPNYLMPMLPPPGAITWSVRTYWRAHQALGLRLHQVRRQIVVRTCTAIGSAAATQAAQAHACILTRSQVPTTGFVMLMRLLESVDRVHLVGFDGFANGSELHYFRERRVQARTCTASHRRLLAAHGAHSPRGLAALRGMVGADCRCASMPQERCSMTGRKSRLRYADSWARAG